jgi:hypothetical protein
MKYGTPLWVLMLIALVWSFAAAFVVFHWVL